jgi:acyl-CoA thioester hydrolase
VTGTLPGVPPAAFSWPVRIYWEDTDGGGVVYYANYLKFLERARTEWLRARGFVQTELAKDPGIVFVVANVSIEYKRPARLDDSLLVTCEVEPEGAVCIQFAQRILRGTEVLVEASCRVACLDATSFRPKRLPPDLAASIAGASRSAASTKASMKASITASSQARVEAPPGANEGAHLK